MDKFDQFALAVAIHQNLEWINTIMRLDEILLFVRKNTDSTLSAEENAHRIIDLYIAKKHADTVEDDKVLMEIAAQA